jgi:hypothetical protein
MRNSIDGFDERLYAEKPTRFFTLDSELLVFARDAAGKISSVAVDGVTFTQRGARPSGV